MDAGAMLQVQKGGNPSYWVACWGTTGTVLLPLPFFRLSVHCCRTDWRSQSWVMLGMKPCFVMFRFSSYMIRRERGWEMKHLLLRRWNEGIPEVLLEAHQYDGLGHASVSVRSSCWCRHQIKSSDDSIPLTVVCSNNGPFHNGIQIKLVAWPAVSLWHVGDWLLVNS